MRPTTFLPEAEQSIELLATDQPPKESVKRLVFPFEPIKGILATPPKLPPPPGIRG